jgi:hypothetical protein
MFVINKYDPSQDVMQDYVVVNNRTKRIEDDISKLTIEERAADGAERGHECGKHGGASWSASGGTTSGFDGLVPFSSAYS